MTSARTGAVALLAILVVALLLLAPVAVWAADVAITAEGIDPDPIEAEMDEIVSFTNQTDAVVRLIDDAGRWDSGDLAPDARFTITFEAAGTYGFTSEDGAITGTIVVAAAAGATPAPTEAEPTATPAPTEDPATEDPATEDPATEAPATEAPATEAPAPEAPPTEELAATGLPSAALAWAAALSTLAGIVVLRRTGSAR